MFDVICNSTSGSVRRKKYRQRVEEAFAKAGAAVVFHEPSSHAETLALAAKLSKEGEGNIVAMGGDGTINAVLNGIEDFSRVRLGILPGGSGNDFAMRIGIPENPEKAVEVLLNSEAKLTDFYDCSGVRGINVVGSGIDVEILETYAKMKVFHGKFKYLASLIKVLFHFNLYGLSILRESGPEKHSALIICAANGSTYGGGLKVCPKAVPDDGLLDLVVINDLPKRRIPGALVNLLRGKILEQDYAQHERVKTVSAEFDQPVLINIDGELHPNLPFNVKVVSGVLRVYRP